MSHDVFISYSSPDQQYADRVCDVLERAGLSCWISHRDNLRTLDPNVAALKGIERSRVLVLVLSSLANDDPVVAGHVAHAAKKKKKILYLQLTDAPLSSKLAFWLGAERPVDPRDLTTLAGAVHELIGTWKKRAIAAVVLVLLIVAIVVLGVIGLLNMVSDGTRSPPVRPTSTVTAPPPAAECYEIDRFGTECVGRSCGGGLHEIWNCDLQKRARVRCENGVVVARRCSGRCRTMPGGKDDLCE